MNIYLPVYLANDANLREKTEQRKMGEGLSWICCTNIEG